MHGCWSLCLWRCMLRVPRLLITVFVTLYAQGSTATDHCVSDAVCYMVPHLQISAFVTLYAQGFTAADHCVCDAVCYRVPQLQITVFVTLYDKWFHSCRSLHLWRCILQGSTAADHCLWRCTLHGSTAADHCICDAVCYRVPQLQITEFSAMYDTCFYTCWSLCLWCRMYRVPQLQITAFVTQVLQIWSEEGKLDSEFAIKLKQHTDFTLKASGSYHAHNTVYSNEHLWFP
jgi:hypothetical protein